MADGYGAVASMYWELGWRGVLPLPAGQKTEPPSGWTGRKAGERYPSYADVMTWAEDHRAGNVALRMPLDVIGIDVDAYGGKVGAATLAELGARLGPLPATWISTSRDDGVSGIRFYRVPERLEWRDTGTHVETLWWGARYAVVAPSVHPEGRPYRWIAPDGTPADLPCKPEELPELPAAWVAELQRAERPAPASTHAGDPFAPPAPPERSFTTDEAIAFCRPKLDALRGAQNGEINNRLNDAAKMLGHFVAGGFWTRDEASSFLLNALGATVYDGKTWKAEDTIRSGLGAVDWVAERKHESATAPESTPAAKLTLRERMRERLYDRDGLDSIPAPSPLIAGVLDVATLAFLSGKFGTYKTFVSISWACSIATGLPWFGHEVPAAGPVLYVAGEGGNGLRQRIETWEAAHLDGARIPAERLRVYDGRIKLNAPDEVEVLAEFVSEIRPAMTVIDTLHKCAPGVNEDNSTEMSVILDVAADLRERYGTTVLFNHHTGHSGVRSRGTSSIEDDADTSWVIRLSGEDQEDRSAANPRVLEHRKTKNGATCEEIPLQLITVGDSAYVSQGVSLTLANGLLVPSIVARLDDAGVPRGLSVRDTTREGRALDLKYANSIWREVTTARKPPLPPPDLAEAGEYV